ncbi:MAG: prolipoprotein diacylglyceryl transferase [Litorimonas sp.]
MSLIHAIKFPNWLSENIISIGPLTIKWYGVAYIIGLMGAYYYAYKMSERRDVWIAGPAARKQELIPNKDMLSDLMTYCLVGIIAGGRLGYVILYQPSMITQAPLDVLKVWEGGMAFHGGFLGVCGAVIYAAWRNKLDLMRIADMAAIGAPIGLGAVRFLGNFLNQELWGRATDVPWAMIFPKDFDSIPRHPSQLYEAILEGLVIFLVLRVLCIRFKALTRPGVCTGGFIFMYGLFRFTIEFFREPDVGIAQFGFLTRGMTYSLPMIIIGGALLLWTLKRGPVSPKRAALKDENAKDAQQPA